MEWVQYSSVLFRNAPKFVGPLGRTIMPYGVNYFSKSKHIYQVEVVLQESFLGRVSALSQDRNRTQRCIRPRQIDRWTSQAFYWVPHGQAHQEMVCCTIVRNVAKNDTRGDHTYMDREGPSLQKIQEQCPLSEQGLLPRFVILALDGKNNETRDDSLCRKLGCLAKRPQAVTFIPYHFWSTSAFLLGNLFNCSLYLGRVDCLAFNFNHAL